MAISAFEALYKKLGIISEKDYKTNSRYLEPIDIQFVKQCLDKEDFNKDYAFADDNSFTNYIIRGVCFDYKIPIRNHFKYQVGYYPGSGYCVYTESEEMHRVIQATSSEYICMYCALQLFEQQPQVLQMLDQCARKYGKDSEQVKYIWYAFFYKNNASMLGKYKELVMKFADGQNEEYKYHIVSIEDVLDFVINREENDFKVIEKPIKCQVCESIRTAEQQRSFEKQKSKEKNWNIFVSHIIPIIIYILITGIINLIAFVCLGSDRERLMESSVPFFMYAFGGCIGGWYILERYLYVCDTKVEVIIMFVTGIILGITPTFVEYGILSLF